MEPIRYLYIRVFSCLVFYSISNPGSTLARDAKYTQALKLHVRNTVNYRAKNSEDTENNQDGFHNKFQC